MAKYTKNTLSKYSLVAYFKTGISSYLLYSGNIQWCIIKKHVSVLSESMFLGQNLTWFPDKLCVYMKSIFMLCFCPV